MNYYIKNLSEIYDDISKEIIGLVNSKANPILGLATGSSPIGIYERLVNAYNKGEVCFKNTKTFNLDEYVGLDSYNPNSYRYYMNNNLFNKIDIDINNTFLPSLENCDKYDDMIKTAGGIDIMILGIGSNGHIGFNEPYTSFDSLTHVTDLTESTIKDNSRLFSNTDEVPKKAITMGIESIMRSKKIVMVITGKNKKNIIKELKKGIVHESIPASILYRHKNVDIYIDKSI